MKEWGMEENKKRMINRYYEGEMWDIMGKVLSEWSSLSVIDILVVGELDL